MDSDALQLEVARASLSSCAYAQGEYLNPSNVSLALWRHKILTLALRSHLNRLSPAKQKVEIPHIHRKGSLPFKT